MVKYGKPTKGNPTFKPVLRALPLEDQWAICKKHGGYDEAATEKWAHLAPAGYDTAPIIPDESVLAAYKAFLADAK